VAWGNSHVEAWDNSRVVAWDNSRVEAWGNSHVEARGNSRVEAWDNSRVEAWDNSRVVAWGNSHVEAWGNCSVELFISAYVTVMSTGVLIKKLLDYSTAVFRGCPIRIEEKSDTASAREVPADINPSFDEWLRRGYVHADGICKKLVSRKKVGEVEVFEVEEFYEKTTSFVVRRGETFSHGETIEKAIDDLRYKISGRDTSEFECWRDDRDQEISLDDAIAGYRVITGACEFGVKEFIESIQVPDKLTPNVVLKLTEGKYGNDTLGKFLEMV